MLITLHVEGGDAERAEGRDSQPQMPSMHHLLGESIQQMSEHTISLPSVEFFNVFQDSGVSSLAGN